MKTPLLPLDIAFCSLALCLPQAAMSQTAEVEPLKPLRAPMNAAWTVDIRYPAQTQSAAPQENPEQKGSDTVMPPPVKAKSVYVQKQKDVYLEVVAFDDGSKEERWVLDGMQFKTSDGGGNVMRLLPSDSTASDYSETDFPDLAWVSGLKPRMVEDKGRQLLLVEVNAADRPLTKKEQSAKQMMDLFAKQYAHSLEQQSAKTNGATSAAPQMPTMPEKPTGTIRLYLDPKTKLPVRYESQEQTWIYSFPANVEPLRPPEKFRAALEKWSMEMKAARRAPSKP
ncbi:MAG: hypothetical protein FGM15_12775 [Chthoniobacterales bacterium]|nr:hypothetical protein [Chthoniobacterales bacterium]